MIDLIYQRMKRYAELDIYLLWVLPDNSPSTFFHLANEINVHRMKKWEEDLYLAYFESIYYWQENAFVTEYHFDDLETWIEETHWYDYNGEERYGGGYYRKTKTLKIPSTGHIMPNKLHIAEDFQPRTHQYVNLITRTLINTKLWVFDY